MAKPRRYHTFSTDADPWMKARICPWALAQHKPKLTPAILLAKFLAEGHTEEEYHARYQEAAKRRMEFYDNLPPHWRAYAREDGNHDRVRKVIQRFGLHNQRAALSGTDSFDIDI